MDEFNNLPRSEFGFPGPLRDRLISAILDGSKTSTTSMAVEYLVEDGSFPEAGTRQVVVDSAGKDVAVIETTDVQQVRLADVSWEHAREEGEGYASVAEWRAGHERFWHGKEMRGFLENPGFTVDDDTLVVLERFRLVRTAPG
ncbi:ASCH domain-containing protein [Pseudarthrobacter sulfonivorans]|uniref:ASCH domain-containing protein n=1 Tax=Pseudarthrobacter sulfonivorans TaxID=121292 RepID=UPI002858EEEE|nr:ASCH domain-containing protein [Pseudarthrobacter sulfonivorans]MDR6415648.1 uncharacterized protein YhfF [Pseudarthrobacter sulfonivorans]